MKKKNKEKKVLEPQYYTSRINTSTYNYKVYYMSVPEKIINVLIAFVIGACIGYLFYGGIGKDEYGQEAKAVADGIETIFRSGYSLLLRNRKISLINSLEIC